MSQLFRNAFCLSLVIGIGAGGCSPRTELIVGITTDLVGVADPLTSAHFTVLREGRSVADQTWKVGPDAPATLPGSVGIYTDDGAAAHLVIELTGTLQSGKTLKRDAVVDLTQGATLFMRMMLAEKCVDKSCDGQTCVEGMCRPLLVDPSQLPTWQAGMELGLECDSGSQPLATHDGQKVKYRPGPDPAACDSRSSCTENTCYRVLVTCSGAGGTAEANLTTDVKNCGGCGVACPALPFADAVCAGGTCGFTCTPGHADCDHVPATGCEIDIGSNPGSCGGCGLPCVAANAMTGCTKGVCAITGCAAGWSDCDGKYDNGCEVNSATDLAHCGGCGTSCAADHGQASCTMGACAVMSCAPPFADCDSKPGNGCEAPLDADPSNCGMCGKSCALDNAISGCLMRGCVVMSCMTGFANCDHASANGCEVDLQGDPDNCGGCGVACASTNMSTRTCVKGVCSGDCKMGFADCNGDKKSDGCEVNVTSDYANCGGCKKPCGANQVCGGSTCKAGCAMGQSICNNSCVDLLTDTRYCGSCLTACNIANANNYCQNGACRIACPVDAKSTWYDCDGAQKNGCESNIITDSLNCGGCGNPCSANGLVPQCAGGSCESAGCNSGYADCNKHKRDDGCEVKVDNNPDNCGQGGTYVPSGCGVVCSNINMATRTCAAGVCNGDCKTGFADCDSDKQKNGCEINLNTDANNCGVCGTKCGHANIAPACAGGQCSLACNTGYADCNGDKLKDGCEININTDVVNCGGCKMSCSPMGMATNACTAGMCTGTCVSGWADCNHNKLKDGCEVSLGFDDNNCGSCGVVCPGIQHCKSGKCVL